jgi:shikimate kinase
MKTLWLTGVMGAGKSTVAPLVAARLERVWVDTDRLVEESTGETVAAMFARAEAEFRRAEAEAVRAVAGSEAVVACGGGVVLDRDLVSEMRRTGVVVWLRPTADALARRTLEGRPLLAGDDGALSRIAEERSDRYAEAAHVVIDGDGSPETVAERVVEAWSTLS